MARKWTEEACQIEALKYSTHIEFKRESKGAYLAARKNGFLEKICSHMPPDDRYKRLYCLYVIKNKPLKSVYIGITSQSLSDRVLGHKKKDNPLLLKRNYSS